jgi:hypothetical protein
MAGEAARRGLERDTSTVLGMQRKREALLVEHLYQDSVASRVWASPQEHREFYKQHLSAYFTFPTATFAIFACRERAAAETLGAHLRAGEDPQRILADSLYGIRSGSIQTRRQNEQIQFQKLVFEELRPGQVAVEGPGKDGSWFVIKQLVYDPGRQLSYEEAAGYVDQDLQKIRGEEALAAFVARLRKRYPWSSRPDLVMRVSLVSDD